MKMPPMRYPIASPDLSGNELAYVTECLKTSWISSQGTFVEEFERLVATRAGCQHGIATCNGTAALHLALAAMGVGPGDEVIVPSLTFVATANAVTYCGAEPVFADSDPRSWCLCPQSVERLIGPRTRGIIPVHLYGQPCEMDALRDIAQAHGLWILEDAAEALGAEYRGQPVGSFGRAGTFSFFGNKTVVTGEGGMVVTNDDALATQLRLLRGQGMDPQRRYWHSELGFNYRLTNVAAAIGVAQMERLDEFLTYRRRIARVYRSQLARVPELSWSATVPDTQHAYWMVSALVSRPRQRETLFAELNRAGIETRPFFHPVHHFPMYQQSRTDEGCPTACDLSRHGFSLPTATYLTAADVNLIADTVADALRGSTSLSAQAA